MNRSDAEKMADEIFDMVDRNHPRGLIKSQLVDLLAKWTPQPDVKQDVTETGETYFDKLLREAQEAGQKMRAATELYYVSDTGGAQHVPAKEALKGLGYHFKGDLCGND